ncbi:efflux RND transporter permease subunit, partial [Streptomyces sp. DT225]
MKVIHARRAAVALSAALVLPLALTACSDDSKDSASGSSASSAKAPASPSAEKSMDADKPFGPACASVPKSGAGSFTGMAKDPVATAASHNPALSTLVTAVSIPLSVVLALIVLWTRDLSLNMLTLGALTIAIGRVVGDSIVGLADKKRHL